MPPKNAAHVVVMTNNRLTDNRNPFIRSTKPKDNTMTNITTHRSSFAMIPDAEVITASDRVNQTKLVDAIREWRAANRGSRVALDRPVLVSDHAILVGMLLLASSGHPIGARNLVDLFAGRLTNDSRLLLGIDQSIASPHDDRHAYRAVHNALRRLFATIDPYPHNTAALALPTNSPDKEQSLRVQTTRARLDAFSDAFLTMTLAEGESQLGTSNGRMNVALTDSFIAATDPRTPRMTATDSVPVGAHPKLPKPSDGRYWAMNRTDRPGPLTPDGLVESSPWKALKRASLRWGWEAVIALQIPSTTNETSPFPRLALSFALHRPGVNIQENSIKVLQTATRHARVPGVLIADRPYFDAPSNVLPATAAALGYTSTYLYRRDRLGIQDADENAILVEGSLYHPDMPQPFIDATLDYLDGRIDEATYQLRLSRRERFVVRPSGAAKKRFQPQLQAFPYGSKAWKETYGRGRNAGERLTSRTAASHGENASSLVEAQVSLTMRLVAYNLHEIERQLMVKDHQSQTPDPDRSKF
jgi:hypothetical protein